MEEKTQQFIEQVKFKVGGSLCSSLTTNAVEKTEYKYAIVTYKNTDKNFNMVHRLRSI